MEQQVPPTQSYSQPPVQQDLPNATAVLIMGILSLVLCGLIGLILGIIGLNMGNKALALYDQNAGLYTESSFKNAKAGKTCSLIGVILGSVGIVIAIVYFIFVFAVVGAAAAGNSHW